MSNFVSTYQLTLIRLFSVTEQRLQISQLIVFFFITQMSNKEMQANVCRQIWPFVWMKYWREIFVSDGLEIMDG